MPSILDKDLNEEFFMSPFRRLLPLHTKYDLLQRDCKGW